MAITEPLYTAAEMRAAEEAYDGPTLELMERAGIATADAILRRYADIRSFSVWCGTGSNGGDGLVVARKLHEAGRAVEIRLPGEEATASPSPPRALAARSPSTRSSARGFRASPVGRPRGRSRS
jgi:NAD(P)H-hydrate repair Nnr-like enzyme with NAD(P)H-hydrate epimerase domain